MIISKAMGSSHSSGANDPPQELMTAPCFGSTSSHSKSTAIPAYGRTIFPSHDVIACATCKFFQKKGAQKEKGLQPERRKQE